MSTLQVDRIEPYQSASVTIVGLDVDTTALNNFTASQEVINSNLEATTASLESSVTNLNGFTASQETLNTTFATTGSNTFSGNQVVSGDITATKLTLSGGAGNDLIVTGSATFTSTVQSNTGMQAGTTVVSYLNPQIIATINNSTADEIGFTYDTAGWGVSGWTGPSFYLNDPTDSYPAVIGFQNKASWTDGTITMLKPLVVSGSVQVSGSVKQTFAQPSNSQLALNTVAGTFTIPSTGAPYNYVENSFAGYGFGNAYNGWLWESWDSLSFNYGSDTSINASGFYTLVQPSGSSNAFNAELRVRDNYDGTTTAYIYGTTLQLGNQKTNNLVIGKSDLTSVISGSVSVEKILTLAPQDPLPSGAVGQVAVSGSNLYFYTDQWREVAFV